MGNGICLGLYDGKGTTAGLRKGSSYFYAATGNVGKSVGTSSSGDNSLNNGACLGVIKDATKSGLTCEKDSDIKYIIKY